MEQKNGLKFSYALSLATQLGFLIVSSVVGFLALGLWLDIKFNSAPIMLLLGIVVGIVVTIFEVIHMMKPLITKDKKHD